MPSCAVATCTNTGRNKQVRNFSWHAFPTNREFQKQWQVKCKRQDSFRPEIAVICSEHFLPSDFDEDKVNKVLKLKERVILKNGAVPSVKLPSTTKLVNSERGKRFEKRHQLKTKLNLTKVSNKQHKSSFNLNADENRIVELDLSVPINTGTHSETQTLHTGPINLLGKCYVLEAKNELLINQIQSLRTRVTKLKAASNRRKRLRPVTPLTTLNIFSKAQLKKLSGNKSVRWTSQDIAKSLSVASMSKNAFEAIRKVWKIPLPAPSTLRSWAIKFKCLPGLLPDILTLMGEETKSMNHQARLCIINFDEMKVSSLVQYDRYLDRIVGPHENSQILIVSGLCRKWRQPIFYDYDQKMTKDILYQSIMALEHRDFRVCAIVNDLGGTNRQLWNELQVNSANPRFINPFNSSKNIWVFADAPHMLKLLRNHVLDGGWVLPTGTIVNKKTLEELLLFDSAEIKLCPKLTRNIIDVKAAERMKVSPAAKVFSHQVATLAGFCFKDRPEIKDFFQNMNDYFDIFNSRVPKGNDNPLQWAYGLDIGIQNGRLNEIETCVKMLRCRVWMKKRSQFVSRNTLLPCQHGILSSISALKGMYAELNKEYNLKYIITRRLNQDPLESFFSQIRALGRTNDNPTPVEFRSRMKILLLGSKVKSPLGSNVEEDEAGYYMSARLFDYVINQHTESKMKSNCDTGNSNDIPELETVNVENTGVSGASIKYLAGYLAFVLKTKHDLKFGDISRNALNNASEGISDAWIFELSRGGLILPNDQIVNWVLLSEGIFCSFFSTLQNGRIDLVSKKLENSICSSHPDMNINFVKEFIKIRIKIRVIKLNTEKKPICGEKRKSRGVQSKKNVKKAKQFLK